MQITDSIYEVLTNEDDARLCDDIGEDACREAPQSFVLVLASYCFTKLGDAIASPKTTLAWLTTALGAPAFVLALLVPIRESGSMVPQLFIGAAIRRMEIRKWVWVGGSLVQGLCILGIGAVAVYLDESAAGWAILSLIVTFSLARAFCSVAAKDVLGKTIPKRKRGQLTGWSASAAGLMTVTIGVVLMLSVAEDADRPVLALLLFGAGALWFAAASIYARLPEFPGETGGARGAAEALRGLRLLADDKPFRRFVITRALLMCSALSAPFYVALAQANAGSNAAALGAFVAAAGVASLVSAPVWGRFADSSSKQVMIVAASLTAAVGVLTVSVHRFFPAAVQTGWFLPLAYFLLSLAHSGVRVGRKTYVVNLGSGNKRTDYVAISNSVIGVLLLLVGSVGALAPIIGNAGVIGLLTLMGLCGAAFGNTLPET